MNRMMPLVSMCVAVAGGLFAGCMLAAGPALVLDSLEARVQVSRVELQNQAYAGHLVKRGTVLILQADRIPAK